MATTNNLWLTLLDSQQAQQDVVMNEAIVALDNALTEARDVECTDSTSGNIVDANDYRECICLRLVAGSPGPTAAIDVELPAIKRAVLIRNECGEDADVYCSGDLSTVTVANGATALIYNDGTTVRSATGVPGAVPYDIGAFCAGAPGVSEVLLRFVATRAFTLPSSLADSQVKAGAAATASTDFDVQKNGSSIGTISFAASGTSATFTFSSPVAFAAGDILSIVAPASQDATLADISFTLAGSR